LLIPSSESSLAVRAYYLDCDDLEEFEHNNINKDSTATTNKQGGSGSGDDDFDNLAAFLNAFQLAVVLFILTSSSSPPSSSDQLQREQLDRPSSLFHRAQRLVRSVTLNDDPNTVSRERERE
jgi:hypothetical protein